MEAFVIGATLVGSIATAFVVQRAALSALLRVIAAEKTKR